MPWYKTRRFRGHQLSNFYEVIDVAATKPFGFVAYYPGPGLGGHCIPIDPFISPGKPESMELIHALLNWPAR